MIYSKIFLGMGIMLVGVGLAAKTPETKVAIVHPTTTEISTLKPVSPQEGSVQRPQTVATVNRPSTQITVLKPVTTVTVNQLKTEGTVTHPQTEVYVGHPTTLVGGNEYKTPQTGTPSKTSKGVNSIPSSSSATTMSGFQMPKAKELKAANLTAGEEGLGRPNDAEKSAAAAAFTIPKGENASAENLQSIVQKAQNLNKATLEQKIENKVK